VRLLDGFRDERALKLPNLQQFAVVIQYEMKEIAPNYHQLIKKVEEAGASLSIGPSRSPAWVQEFELRFLLPESFTIDDPDSEYRTTNNYTTIN
jgi:hypothetical protein